MMRATDRADRPTSGPRVPIEMYGLTTIDAVRAFQDGHVDLLPSHNRWKPIVQQHLAGLHTRRSLFMRSCPICQVQRSD